MATRRERVILDLQDDFTPGVARATVAAGLLEKQLNSLGGTSVKTGRDLDKPAASARNLGDSTGKAGPQIDRFSGRLKLLADTAVILGPALAPLGAAAVGGVVALSAALGSLAGGLGVTVLAAKGLGDGLKALDAYQLEPTTENLAKLNDEMRKLGPAGEDFIRFLDSIEPNLKTLQNAAREGLLPGAQEGIEELLQRLPEVRKLIRDTAETMGDLFSDAGGAIGGDDFDAFFKYLRTDGIKILEDTGRTVGNLTETVANLFVAFGGVSTDFSGGLLKFSEGLKEASANLDSNAGFQEFVHYIQTEGPRALKTIGSLANAFLQVVEAAAPLGGPVLTILGKFADIIAKVADSDFGTPIFAGIAALTVYNRGLQATAALSKAAAAVNPVSAGIVLGAATVLTFKGAWDKAGDSVEAFQSALQAASGDIAAQTALIEGLRDAAAEMQDDVSSDSFFEGFKNAFDPDTYVNDFRESLGMDTGSEQLTSAADDAARALKNQRDGVDTLVAPLAGLRVGLEKATEAQQEQNAAINASVEAMRDQREEALRAANAELDYQQSIDDARKALKENGKTVDETTDKGRNNLRALYNLAGAWNGQSQVIKDNAGALRTARQNFIDTATSMGMTEGAARKLSRQLFEIPTKRQIDITMDTHGATAELIALKARMDAIKDKHVSVTVNTVRPQGGQAPTEEQVGNPRRAPRTSTRPRTSGRGSTSTSLLDPLTIHVSSRGSGASTAKADLFDRGDEATSPFHQVAIAAQDAASGLKGLKKQLEQQQKAYDKAKQSRDAAVSRRDSLAGTITSGLTGDSIFSASEGSVWASGAHGANSPQGAIAALSARTDRARRFVAALNLLKSKGVTGAALQAIISEGLDATEAMAGADIGTLASFAGAVNESNAALAAAGLAGGNAVEGANVRASNKRLDRLHDDLQEVKQAIAAADKNNQKASADNAFHVVGGVNGAAHNGHRRGR